MKWAVLREHVLMPLAGRVGTMIATGLVLWGVQAELASQVAVGVTAVILVIADLGIGYLNRKAYVQRKLEGEE